MRLGLGLGLTRLRRGIQVPTPGAINAPSITRTSVAGTVPFEWATTVDNSVYAGDVWRLETSASNAVNPDGSFVTPIQVITKQISPSEFEPGYIADWTTAANPSPSATFNTPSGTFYFHVRVERYTEIGTIVSPWSNVLTDTILVATTSLHTTNGVDKNQFVAVTGRVAEIVDVNVGAPCMVRATQAAAPSKFAFEVTLDRVSIYKSYISIDDGSNVYGPTVYNAPGAGTRTGISLQFSTTETAILFAANDGQFTLPAAQNGDVITITGDRVSNEIKFFRTRAGVTTQIGITKVLPIGTSWFAALGHERDGKLTANFGQTAFVRPLDAGHSMYG